MALYKVIVTRNVLANGVRLDRGMGVEVNTPTVTNPVSTNNGSLVKDAFMRIYGVDLNPVWASVRSGLQVTQMR